MSETYRVGQAAASGDEPAGVVMLSATPTETGAVVAEYLRTLPHTHRLHVRGVLAGLGWRRITHVQDDDAERVTAAIRQAVRQAERIYK